MCSDFRGVKIMTKEHEIVLYQIEDILLLLATVLILRRLLDFVSGLRKHERNILRKVLYSMMIC